MLLAIEHILGAVLALDLDVHVDSIEIHIPGVQAFPPHLHRLLARHAADLHEELWAIKRAQDELIDSLPSHDQPRLGKAWWRFRIAPEPAIPSFQRVRFRNADDGPEADCAWTEARDALRRRCTIRRRLAPLPERFDVEIGRDEGRHDGEGARAVKVADIRFVPAPAELRSKGLRGWAGCIVDDAWHVDSIAVRRTRDGRYALSFPARRDGAGISRPYFHPIDDAARVAIETAVLGTLFERGFIS